MHRFWIRENCPSHTWRLNQTLSRGYKERLSWTRFSWPKWTRSRHVTQWTEQTLYSKWRYTRASLRNPTSKSNEIANRRKCRNSRRAYKSHRQNRRICQTWESCQKDNSEIWLRKEFRKLFQIQDWTVVILLCIPLHCQSRFPYTI